MADPAKYKSVSVPMEIYKILVFLGDGKLTDANLTISKTIEVLAKIELIKSFAMIVMVMVIVEIVMAKCINVKIVSLKVR
jgi:hypothetical protein